MQKSLVILLIFVCAVCVLRAQTPPAAPIPRPSFDAASRSFSIQYQTLSGQKYRVLGGGTLTSLAPLTLYFAGADDELTSSVGSTILGNAK